MWVRRTSGRRRGRGRGRELGRARAGSSYSSTLLMFTAFYVRAGAGMHRPRRPVQPSSQGIHGGPGGAMERQNVPHRLRARCHASDFEF